jgi:hypothetical protein
LPESTKEEDIRSNKTLADMFHTNKTYVDKAKKQGVGQTTILKFLGDGWKQLSFRVHKSYSADPPTPRQPHVGFITIITKQLFLLANCYANKEKGLQEKT